MKHLKNPSRGKPIQIFKVQDLLKNPWEFDKVIQVIAKGGVLVYPTETLYGIGCDPYAPNRPLEKISKIKQRQGGRPYIFLIPDIRFLEENQVKISHTARTLMERFWPGPLTLVLPVSSSSPLVPIAYKNTLAVRVSPHPFVQALFKHYRFPLASTSANLSGAPEGEARDPEKIKEIFAGQIDMLVTEGFKKKGLPSTIIDISTTPLKVLREGAIPLNQDFMRF